jgi:hypothetical protein
MCQVNLFTHDPHRCPFLTSDTLKVDVLLIFYSGSSVSNNGHCEQNFGHGSQTTSRKNMNLFLVSNWTCKKMYIWRATLFVHLFASWLAFFFDLAIGQKWTFIRNYNTIHHTKYRCIIGTYIELEYTFTLGRILEQE